jgi:hypothetical protein
MPKEQDNKLTSADRVKARVLKFAPWIAPFLFALPGPILFALLYLMSTSTEAAALYIFLAFISLAAGSIAGLVVAIFMMFYRKRWMGRIRDRLAVDGITANEVSWFMNELTSAERLALDQIETQNLLLADAYRETLASRLTASRVVSSAKRNLMLVERRLNRTAYMEGQTTATLQEELRSDRSRLESIKEEAIGRRSEAEARLQMIEAAASRGQSWAETNAALQRLNTSQAELPLALESARIDQKVREDVEKEMRREEQPSP